MTLRDATLTDLDALLRLEQTFPGDRISRRNFRHLLSRANAEVAVAEEEGRVVGNAVALYRKGSERARLYSLVVAPEERGRGLGLALLQEVETRARARGCERVGLEVREDNAAAIRLYEQTGYELTGRITDYYDDHGVALRMEKRF